MRRIAYACIGLGLVAVLVIGLTQTAHKNKQAGGSNSAPVSRPVKDAARRLAGSPAPLAALHEQSSALLGGGGGALQARLAALKGHPVVLNVWGSWCGPCRYEFPFLQQLSVRFGRRVAFVGLDVEDNHGDATDFLRRFPVSYPSYEDPHRKVVHALKLPQAAPITRYLRADGDEEYTHQGVYRSQREMAADIERYALGGS